MKVAVIGSGISGLVSAYVLAKEGVEVVLYEKKDYLGGHARTVTYDGVDLDLGFMVFNHVLYPNMMEFFESLGVDMETCDMSFSVSLDKGRGCEWGSRNSLSSLFAEKKNLFNPYFWKMLREITKFKHDLIRYFEVLEGNPDIDRNETLGQFIESHDYSELFLKAYLFVAIIICFSYLEAHSGLPSNGVHIVMSRRDARRRYKELWKRKHETGQWLEIEAAKAMSNRAGFSAMNASGIVLLNMTTKPNELAENNGKATYAGSTRS